jgi:hypothetical protein
MGRAYAAIAALMLSAALAAADVVELKTGQKLEGKVKSVTPTEVVIEIGGKDTKVESRFLRDPADQPAKAAMKDAVALHVYALTAWETSLRTFGYAALETDPSAEQCAALKRVLGLEEKSVAAENTRLKAGFERESKARAAAKEPPPPDPAPVTFEAGPVIDGEEPQ